MSCRCLVQAALRDALSTSAFIAVTSLVAKAAGTCRVLSMYSPFLLACRPRFSLLCNWKLKSMLSAEPHTASAQDLHHVARGLLRWLGAPDTSPFGTGFSGGSGSGSGEFQTPPRASAPGRRDPRSAGSPTASTAASSNAAAATPSPGVTTRSARRRSAEAAAKAAAAAASAGAAAATPSGNFVAAATPAKQAGRSTVDGKTAWQELLQSRQHEALLDTRSLPWLQPAQQQASLPAAQAAMPALPAEAWQVALSSNDKQHVL